MVFVNYTTMQVTAKIVYYGPGLGGKTTNLQWIHHKTAPGSRGEMVSLETQTDRTLFFDLLPLDVGVIGGMKVRLQLYTVPGQVFYNATRQLVLKGVDGVVFVADSQEAAEDANVESLNNLRSNLSELGLPVEQIPIVLQYNKRDIRNIVPVQKMQEALNPGGTCPSFEAAALHGVGVFETLKGISRAALESIKKKIAEDKKAPVAPARSKPVTAPRAAGSRAPAPARSAEDLLPGLVVDEPGSGDVRVEFAEEDTDKHAVRPVRTKAGLDIHAELEKLRTFASGGAVTAVRDKDVERFFKELVITESEKRREIRQKTGLDVFTALLQGSSELRLRLTFVKENGEEVPGDTVSIKLSGNRNLERLTVYLDLDLKGKH